MGNIERKDYYCPHCDELIDRCSSNRTYKRLLNMMRKRRKEDKLIIEKLKDKVKRYKKLYEQQKIETKRLGIQLETLEANALKRIQQLQDKVDEES